MDSKTASFRGLIAGPRQYRIPPFQRSYSWEKPERETLWLDILTQYERLLSLWDLPEHEREDRLKSLPTHYLGTVVLAGPTSLGVPKSDVIDGQQRITTLLLALCALRDVSIRQLRQSSPGEEDLADRLDAVRRRINNQFLINADADPDERLRLQPLARDRKAFLACLNHDGVSQLTAASLGLGHADSPRALQAYQFFLAELRRQQVDPERNPQLARFASLFPLRLEIVREVIASRLTVIMIETKNLDDVNSIFESLNATGRPLTQLDLLRNYVFMLLGARAESVLDQYWTPMERDHLRAPEVEQLIWADLVSRGHNILQNRTYRTTQAVLREAGGRATAAEQYVMELSRTAVYFQHLLRPETEPNEVLRQALGRLNRAGGRTAHPVVLWLYQRRHASTCTDDQLVACVRMLESFLIRRFLAGLSPNNLNSMFGSMLARIHDDELGGSVVEQLARTMLTQPKDWPTDEVVREGVRNVDFYNSGKTAQRVLILETIDRGMAPRGSVMNYEESDQSIEHILVQARDSVTWESDLRELGESLREIQDKYAHTLGNLTVVTPSENSSLSDRSFERKAAMYAGSSYAMTREVAGKYVEITRENRLWGSAAISERADDLAERICQLWVRSVAQAPAPLVAAPASGHELLDVAPGEEFVAFTSSIPEQLFAESDE